MLASHNNILLLNDKISVACHSKLKNVENLKKFLETKNIYNLNDYNNYVGQEKFQIACVFLTKLVFN